MSRSDPFWDDDGPEYEPAVENKPLTIQDHAYEAGPERMRRLNKIAAEDAKRLFEALTGRPSSLDRIKQ